MNIFLDTSALAKRYFEEPGSEELEALLLSEIEEVFVSALALPEFAAALGRKIRSKDLPKATAAAAMKEIETDWQGVFTKIPLSDELAEEAAVLALSHPLRGADAVHLISAMASKADLFIASDMVLIDIAEKIGLASYDPTSGDFNP